MKIAKIILMVIMVFSIFTVATALINQPSVRPTSVNCSNITSLGLIKNYMLLDGNKVLALFNSSDPFLTYYCVKNMLGLYDYDMYIEITQLDGQYVVLNNTMLVYGVYPGKVNYDNVLRRVDRTKLGPYVWTSSNYVPLGSLNDIANDINNQLQQSLLDEGESMILSTPVHTLDYYYALNVISDITPDRANYTNSRTFSRLASLDIDGTISIVKISLGVWR